MKSTRFHRAERAMGRGRKGKPKEGPKKKEKRVRMPVNNNPVALIATRNRSNRHLRPKFRLPSIPRSCSPRTLQGGVSLGRKKW